MLVCHVSLPSLRRQIAAALAETATADDASTTGQVVFATLVDDPASVHDTVDAYRGEIMKEAASAAASVNAGLVYSAAISEAVTAGSTQDGAVPGISAGTVAETLTAASAQDATTTSAPILAQTLSASRAGPGSVIYSGDISGRSRIIANLGAVT